MRNAICEIAGMALDSIGDRLRWARKQQGHYKTPTDAARAFGWPASTYLGHENGDRNPSRETAKRYARAYNVRWEWLLEKEGYPTEKNAAIKMIGHVEAGGKVVFYPADKVRDCQDAPPHAGVMTRALEAGASLRGVAESGWLYFFDDEKKAAGKHLVGKLCVVALKGGDVLVRTLQPGRKRNRYDLESTSEPTLRDQEIVWASRITWIKPR
jgi:transcriptional regulator with XRE-family HTH domain